MEMETIGKKVAPEAKVNMDRRCENCACFNGKDWCKLHQHSTRAINYGCKTHLTKEEMDVKIKNAQEYLEAQDGIRVNYMLTLMFAMVSASYQIMCKGEAMLGELIGGKDWRFERKKALNDMMKAIAKIESLYSTYFEKDYKEMMSDYGREDFDKYTYDGFQMFSGDLLMLGLTYFEYGYRNNEILHQIIDHIRTSYPNQLNLFTPEFIEQFRIKGDD
jgi:hypothetical protein